MSPKTRPNAKHYVRPHVYCVTDKAFLEAWHFINFSDDSRPRYPQPNAPNIHLRGRDLYDALIKEEIDAKWEDVDCSPAAFHHGPLTDGFGRQCEWVQGKDGRPLFLRRTADKDDDGDDDDDEEEEDRNYPGAVKTDPALRKKKPDMSPNPALKKRTQDRSPNPAAKKKPRVENRETPKKSLLTHGAVENSKRLAQGQKPRGRPKKIKTDLDGANGDSAIAGGSAGTSSGPTGESTVTLPVSGASQLAVLANAPIPQGALTGFEANQKREREGKARRGRPIGSKNKAKSALKSTKSDSAHGEGAGGSSSGAGNEIGEPKLALNGMKADSANAEGTASSSSETTKESDGDGNDEWDNIIVALR